MWEERVPLASPILTASITVLFPHCRTPALACSTPEIDVRATPPAELSSSRELLGKQLMSEAHESSPATASSLRVYEKSALNTVIILAICTSSSTLAQSLKSNNNINNGSLAPDLPPHQLLKRSYVLCDMRTQCRVGQINMPCNGCAA